MFGVGAELPWGMLFYWCVPVGSLLQYKIKPNGFVGIDLLRLVPDALQQSLAAFISAALTVAPNVQLR